MEEFDKVQKQLTEDLRQQLDSKYGQETEELYRNEQMQTNEEIQGTAELINRALRKEGQDVPTPREPLTCWKCGEMAHKKKDCVKLLFCVNCVREGHVVSKCRQPAKENCNYCNTMGRVVENCPYRRIDSYRQDNVKPYYSSRSRTPTLVARQQIGRLRDISQRKYEEQTGIKWLQSIPETEGCEAFMATAYEWNQLQLGRENTQKFNIYKDARVLEGNKPSKLQDQNVTNVLTGSNTSEISRAMEKISETNQLLAQQQMVQQKTLQALLHHQEQSSEAQEASQRIQSQALVALTEVAQQRGFDPLFNKIAKYNGKDPEKCHYWLNQVSMACMESGRNFRQLLMFCAEDALLTVLSGLNPALTNDQIREEIMMCFSLALTRRQALERLRAMHQETEQQMQQYIVRHKVAHLRAHKLTADEQCSISEIMEFAMKLQPYIQDKLLKKIDGNRLPRNLCEAYDQAVDIECKNQITSRYGMSAQISQISEYDKDEGYEEIEVMELHSSDGNKFTTNRVDEAQRNFNPTNQGNFNKVGRPGGYVNRQNSGNNN